MRTIDCRAIFDRQQNEQSWLTALFIDQAGYGRECLSFPLQSLREMLNSTNL
jgi:hypothetical protein